MVSDPGWVVTPKEAPAELAEDFEAERFTAPEPLHAHSDETIHIRDWASFLELCDDDSRKILAGYMSVGEPTP